MCLAHFLAHSEIYKITATPFAPSAYASVQNELPLCSYKVGQLIFTMYSQYI